MNNKNTCSNNTDIKLMEKDYLKFDRDMMKVKIWNLSRRNKFEGEKNYMKETLNLLLLYPRSKEMLWTRVVPKVSIKAQTKLKIHFINILVYVHFIYNSAFKLTNKINFQFYIYQFNILL
jgi:hypothetical protein